MPEMSEATAENHFYVWWELHQLRKPAAETKIRTQKERRDVRFQTGQTQTGKIPFLRWRSRSAWEVGQSKAERDQVQHMTAARSGHKHQCCNSAWARRKHVAQHTGMKAKSTEAAEAKGTQMFHHPVNTEWEHRRGSNPRVRDTRDGSSRSSEDLASTLTTHNLASVNEIGLKQSRTNCCYILKFKASQQELLSNLG